MHEYFNRKYILFCMANVLSAAKDYWMNRLVESYLCGCVTHVSNLLRGGVWLSVFCRLEVHLVWF
jgi:hypothetical protein